MTEVSDIKRFAKDRVFWVLIIATLITLTLYFIPFLNPASYPFLLLSTLVHEMGHGMAAVLVGGRFNSFNMWADGSGVANISGSFGPLSRAFISACGLIGPSITAALFFSVIKSVNRSRMMLSGFGILLTISILLVVRNLFAILFVFLVAALCFYFSFGAAKKYSRVLLAFLAAQLALSVFSRSDYLFTPHAVTSSGLMPSDVAQIADALFLPYWFWGIVCGLISLVVLFYGVKRVFK